jgi:hypothetical protein
VYVVRDREGEWSASWQDEGNRYTYFDGPREAVLDWARAQPAAVHLVMYNVEAGEYLPLD